MKQYLFVGDTHGDMDFLQRALEIAHDNGVTDVIQVGDFGYLWPKYDHLEYVSRLCAMYSVTLRWIDGNHDWHTRIRELCEMHSLACTTLPGGGVPLGAPEHRENLIYQPRGSWYKDEDGTRFLFCGGAPSIDWWNRTEGVSWWENEEIISEDEFELAMDAPGRMHVIVTHDAPAFPPGFGPKGDLKFQARGARSMEMISMLVDEHRPELLVHGHWHRRYSSHHKWMNNRLGAWYKKEPSRTDLEGSSRVEGLDCNNAHFIADAMLFWNRDA